MLQNLKLKGPGLSVISILRWHVLPGTALRASGCSFAYLVERNDSVIIVLKIKRKGSTKFYTYTDFGVSRKKESRRKG